MALIKSTLRLATLGVFGTLLASCGNLPEPKDGRTMRDIYDEQMTGGGSAAYSPSQATGSSRPAEDAVPPRYSAYTRSVMTETENLFPTLPNPTLLDRKSTRLNSSHVAISYAVFCLKK